MSGGFSRFRQGKLRLGRIEAFSDGVFAIIVTLLVLELHVPELHHSSSVSELAQGLRDLLPKFFSWLVSFIIVCKFWLNHHHLLNQAAHADYGMVWLNSIFLMFQSFVPFPTALMGEHPDNPLAVSLFGVVMAFNTVLFIVLQRYILRHLAKPEATATSVPGLLLKSLAGPLGYLLGAGLAWINITAGLVFYALTPLLFITPPESPSED